MQFISTDFLFKKNLLSLVLALFPISFIAGNMIININIILLLLLTLFFYKSEIFKINYFLLDKLIISYFILIIFTGFYNHYFYSLENIKSFVAPPEKSLLFLRYLALYLFLRFLVEKKLINLKFFFISCTFATVFVSLDIFYQYYNGKDIFGFETIGDGRKLGGPFGDELIAGGFIQKFALFSFFLLPIFFPNYSYKISKFLVPLLFLIFMFGVMLSGNRMPMILFILTVFLIVLFQKQTRKFFIPFLIIFLFSFFLLFNFNEQVRTNLKTFNVQLIKMKSLIVNKDFYNYNNTTYLREFSTFYETWLMNKYIGGGIKNFRFYCHHRPKVDKNSKFICNMHPHNYYLEILTETGILGFIIILSIFGNALYLSFFKKYFTSSNLRHNNVIIPFIFLFIAEIFPVKSTGSFFTTGNSTYLFLIIGIMIGLIRSNNLIEKKI